MVDSPPMFLLPTRPHSFSGVTAAEGRARMESLKPFWLTLLTFDVATRHGHTMREGHPAALCCSFTPESALL